MIILTLSLLFAYLRYDTMFLLGSYTDALVFFHQPDVIITGMKLAADRAASQDAA